MIVGSRQWKPLLRDYLTQSQNVKVKKWFQFFYILCKLNKFPEADKIANSVFQDKIVKASVILAFVMIDYIRDVQRLWNTILEDFQNPSHP